MIFVVDGLREKYYLGAAEALDSEDNHLVAQSFTGKAGILRTAKFYLRKNDDLAGNIYAKLYAHSGIYGTSSIPTGEVLAVSDAVDVVTIPYWPVMLIAFNFTDEYELADNTRYCIALEYSGGDEGSYIAAGIVTTPPEPSAAHPGNLSGYYNGVWEARYWEDLIFYVYAEGAEPVDEADAVQSIATPKALKTTKEKNGPWTADLEIQYEGVTCEQYIDIEDEQYLVKIPTDIKSTAGAFTRIQAWHIGQAELCDSIVERFSLLKSPAYLLEHILDGSNWTAGDCDIDEIVFLALDRKMPRLEALNLLAEKCGGELYFNSGPRTVDLKRQIGTFTGLHIRYDKNSDYILRKIDSTNLVTRVHPIGSDNYEINTTILDNCEDPADWVASGAGETEASDEKMYGSQATLLKSATLNETFIHDLTAGGAYDLSGYSKIKFWVKSAVDVTNGLTFGAGESAYSENTVNTGALEAECWKEVELDLSAVADADKDAIRYLGFKNLTDGSVEIIISGIRGFYGIQYIDSPNISKYKIVKESVYQHSAKPEKQTFEKIIYFSENAYVKEKYPNTNFYQRTQLLARDNTPESYESFAKIATDEIPEEAVIEEAILNLYCTQIANGGHNAVQARLCTADWSQQTVTWNTKPASDETVATFDMTSAGEKSEDITSAFSDWHSGAESNYGLRIKVEADPDVDKTVYIASNEAGENRPYVKVKYTITTDPSSAIITGATEYLYDHHEPKLHYEVNMCDLSKVMVTTWEEETINLGDTVKLYDKELDINFYLRVHKITKNMLDPSDVRLELVNRAYTIIDAEAQRAKQLSYAMPFKDNPRIIDAGSIQAGYLGGSVQL